MPYQQTTLLQLRNQLKAKFESVPFFTDEECNLAINEALQWYNLYTGVWRQRVVLTTVARQVYYSVPSALLYNTRMEFNSMPMALTSLSDMDNGRPGWEAETTNDVDVPTIATRFIPVGINLFAIWPSDYVGQNSLTIDGVAQTPVLVNDADFVDLDDSELNDLLGEALYLLCFKDPGRLPRAKQWHKEFIDNIMQHNARLNASDAFRHATGVDQDRFAMPIALSTDEES